MESQDIIVAPATPPGEGGVAIIRLSGPGCLRIIQPFLVFSSSVIQLESHRLYHAFFHNQEGCRVDEVMFVYMASPRSFTAEDVVEIHCHGGHMTVSCILDVCIKAGARLARPGEFSYRAFINGRIDLSQAEAIVNLIHARSKEAHSLAVSQADGELSRFLHKITSEIKESLALIEAWLDFPDEELPEEELSSVRFQITQIIRRLIMLCDGYNTGRLYTEGVSLLLLGPPNVGKSSLMNALLGEERAIVTEFPGTTRDLLEEGLIINGLPIRLIDTAGIRQSNDPIEREGVARATSRINTSDLVLLLVDGSSALDDASLEALSYCEYKSRLLVFTKADKGFNDSLSYNMSEPWVSVSAKTGEGLDCLRDAISASLVRHDSHNDSSVLLTNHRHRDSADRARTNLEKFIHSLDEGLSLEFLALDLRDALSALGEITGETTTDDILDSIFGRFCIGK